jgi:circadian clock protein KaiC
LKNQSAILSDSSSTMTAPTAINHDRRCPTGVAGLDEILYEGLPRHRFYLVQGDPGVGKTTLGLQFLLEGARRGEKGLYITLSETREELMEVAGSHQWDLSQLAIFELSSIESHLAAESQNTLFHPSEVELNQISKFLMDEVERVAPVRVVFDSLSELRLLAQNPLRYRRQLLALKQFFAGRKCTVLVMDDRTSDASDREVQSIAHGVIRLEQLAPEYGSDRRRLFVVKVRGVKFVGGYHDYIIKQGGLVVFPRLVQLKGMSLNQHKGLPSGIEALDDLLGGGLDPGTSNLFLGPPGTGKSTLAAHFAAAAASRGEKVAAYTFDEKLDIYMRRADALGMKMSTHIRNGLVKVQQINPAELSPGEFMDDIRHAVEKEDVRLVVIDSLNGYLNSTPEKRFLTIQMHELLTYLSQKGVVTILVLAQQGLLGAMQSPVDVTYLADSVLVLRYFEVQGTVKQAISVIKKRSGDHERTIREFKIGDTGIQVGKPLTEFHGVLSGIPKYQGQPDAMIKSSFGQEE